MLDAERSNYLPVPMICILAAKLLLLLCSLLDSENNFLCSELVLVPLNFFIWLFIHAAFLCITINFPLFLYYTMLLLPVEK